MLKRDFSLLLVGFFFLGLYFVTDSRTENLAASGEIKDGVREIPVRAFRYGFKPDPIVVNAGEKIRIFAQSDDVTHGFAIAEYKSDKIITRTETKVIEFVADKTGIFVIRCSVYCGPGHGQMTGNLIVR